MRAFGAVLVLLSVLCRPAGAASEEGSVTAVAALPAPPAFTVEVGWHDIHVSWAAVSEAQRYQVRWRLKGTATADAHSLLTDQTSVTLPNLSPGTYIVQVGVCQGQPPTCTPRKEQTKRQVKVRGDETLARLTRTFVGSATSVEEFALGLPEPHKHRATFMVDSQALDQDFVSEEHPRVISFGATADTLFAWGTNAASPRYKEVEFIAKEAGDWALGVIDFATTPPTVKRDETCQSCHIGDPPHPLWAQYPGWPGSVTTEYKVRAMERIEAWHETGDSRITAIPVWPDDFHHDRMAYEFNDSLAIRHGEVLIESVMPDEPAAGVPFAQELLCENDWMANIRARFPARQMPSTMGDGQGGQRNVHPEKLPQKNYKSANNADL
ncbi:MAG: fibronectin type III domain-containing protein [Desulfurellaceae bacterium]|nr:fibronectin type III domain-containing protein [Desulfurellaceae bacterium]